MVWAQRVCLCVVVFAGVNWVLNVLHWRWLVRYDRLQVATWMGCVEVDWYEPRGMFAAKDRRAELLRGGVTAFGRNWLAGVLAHMVWLPWVEQFNSSGNPRAGATAVPGGVLGRPGVIGFVVDYTRITIPMWGVGVASVLPYVLLMYRARRRRRMRLCDVCDYSLVGLRAGADGLTVCPECGSKVEVREVEKKRE